MKKKKNIKTVACHTHSPGKKNPQRIKAFGRKWTPTTTFKKVNFLKILVLLTTYILFHYGKTH